MTQEQQAEAWINANLCNELQCEWTEEVTSTFMAGWNAATERAAKLLKQEQTEYLENAKRCDAGGNTFSGTLDYASATCLGRMIAAIRSPEAQP